MQSPRPPRPRWKLLVGVTAGKLEAYPEDFKKRMLFVRVSVAEGAGRQAARTQGKTSLDALYAEDFVLDGIPVSPHAKLLVELVWQARMYQASEERVLCSTLVSLQEIEAGGTDSRWRELEPVAGPGYRGRVHLTLRVVAPWEDGEAAFQAWDAVCSPAHELARDARLPWFAGQQSWLNRWPP